MKDKKFMNLKDRSVHLNKKTGQPSITLPKKKFVDKIPRKVDIKVRW